MQRYADQAPHRVRFEWGARGASAVASRVGAVAVVDVLSFTTCVSVAADAGIAVLPYRWGRRGAAEMASRVGGVCAVDREAARGKPRAVSLSPASLRTAAGWAHDVVLPSPNGATVTAVCADAGSTVVAASLRNRRAVADWLAARLDDGGDIALVACGERWPATDSGGSDELRPALEDGIGAGSVLDALAGLRGQDGWSPEARAAVAAYRAVAPGLATVIGDTASGRELLSRGYPDDVAIALELDSSPVVPVLRNGRYVAARAGVEIRRATTADAPGAGEVRVVSFRAALPTVRPAHQETAVRAWVRDVLIAGGNTWVAVEGSDVVGVLALAPGWVEQLYVHPRAQGRGIGAALLDVAKARNPDGLQLWTFQVNSGAQRFYRRHGFVEAERTDGAENEEREPDMRCVWEGATRWPPPTLPPDRPSGTDRTDQGQ